MSFNKSQATLIYHPDGLEKSYTIPSSVTSIGDSAFSGNDLTSVTIPSSVTSIGNNAFYTNKLTSVTIPSSVTSIGNGAFSYNSLTSVTIPSSVKSIEGGAFQENKLTSVTIPSSVTSIGNYAFSSSTLTSISVNAANPSYSSAGGVLFNKAKTTLVVYPEARPGTSYSIPSGVTSVGVSAFYICLLSSVTIPSSVTSIGNGAFAACSNLGAFYFAGNAPALDSGGSFSGVKNGAKAYRHKTAKGFPKTGANWGGLKVADW